jgi:Secretion system C-terminal sorting domain
VLLQKGIAVFPNPVTNGVVRLSFSEQPAGRYQVQLLDLSGRLITAKEVNVSSEAQIEEFRFPELSVKGNYLLRVTSDINKVNVTNKILVQ